MYTVCSLEKEVIFVSFNLTYRINIVVVAYTTVTIYLFVPTCLTYGFVSMYFINTNNTTTGKGNRCVSQYFCSLYCGFCLFRNCSSLF